MKIYKVSFFAVLITFSTTVAFGADVTNLIANALSNSSEYNGPWDPSIESETGNQSQSSGVLASGQNVASIIEQGKDIYKNSSLVTANNETSEKTTDDADISKLEKKRDIAHNILSGASTAMTGIGGMEMAQGISETLADAEAEKDMKEYVTTFKCNYGKSKDFDYTTSDIALPGGNELVQYYTEYKTLAEQIKADKAALGMDPGIESQVVYDKAQSGLYKNAATGKTSGKFTSVSRALLDENSEDAADWAAQKDKAKKRLAIGATVAAAGLVAGFVGDKLIDKHFDKLVDKHYNELACGEKAEDVNEIISSLPICEEYNNDIRKKRKQGRKK